MVALAALAAMLVEVLLQPWVAMVALAAMAAMVHHPLTFLMASQVQQVAMAVLVAMLAQCDTSKAVIN
jgi:hypothetical protein